MKTFREWLKIDNINKRYFNDLKEIEKDIERIQSHNDNILKFNMFICEAVIEPEKIKINTYNSNKLNKEFEKYNIIFNYGNFKLNGYYDKITDIINIFYSKNDEFNEIEAMIGHEMVHKIQHKHSNKYFEQSKRVIDKINANEKKLINLFNINTIDSMKEWNKLRQENIKLYNNFLYNTVYEKMAYAYQEVKLNTSGKISDIIIKLEKMGFLVDNKLKKYIGMYWLIKDKI